MIMFFEVYFGSPAKMGFQTYVFLLGIFSVRSTVYKSILGSALSDGASIPAADPVESCPLGFPAQCS